MNLSVLKSRNVALLLKYFINSSNIYEWYFVNSVGDFMTSVNQPWKKTHPKLFLLSLRFDSQRISINTFFFGRKPKFLSNIDINGNISVKSYSEICVNVVNDLWCSSKLTKIGFVYLEEKCRIHFKHKLNYSNRLLIINKFKQVNSWTQNCMCIIVI